MIRRKPLPRSTKPILRRVRPKQKNAKRRKSEFARCYGSKARVGFVKSLPCAACGVVGFSDNAHLLGNGGMSRKADADTIGPLCSRHRLPVWHKPLVRGCHAIYDEDRYRFNMAWPDFDPARVATDTEVAWLRHLEAQHG